MKRNTALLLLLSFFTIGTLTAQDLHFSLFNFSPLTLNPAQTGAFYGTARIGGIYRDQWRSALGAGAFRTPSFYIDAPIIRGFGKNDWIGVGGAFFSDQAGTVNLRTNGSLLSASYHLALDKKGNSVLTLGLQGGTVQRRLDQEELRFEEGYEIVGGNWQYNPNNTGETNFEQKSFFDFNGGLMLRSRFNEQTTLELGVAGAHLLEPEYNITSGGDKEARKRPRRITAHGSLAYDLNEKWRVTPMFLFQTTGGATEAMAQVWGGYLIRPDKGIRLNFGTGYRFGDAFPVLLGIDVEDLRVALAYDINTSSLNTATSSVGGFELAASYIIKVYKKPNVPAAILCPEF